MAHPTQKKTSLVPKLRFPEFAEAGEWEEKRLGDAFDNSIKAKKTCTFNNETIITVKLHNLGVVKNKRTEALTGGTNYFIRQSGQFIFSKIDFLNGAFGIIPDDLDGFSSSTDVPAFSFNATIVPVFLYSWLCANYRTIKIERTGTSNTLKRISISKLFDVSFFEPDLSEQQKIADCLTSLDENITAETQKLEALTAHKKGLMQKLFPAEGEKVPALRFPEFTEAGEWEEKRIDDICDSFSGGTPTVTQKNFYAGNIPFIRSAEIDKYQTELYISQEGLANSTAKLVKSGDILVALYGANSGEVSISKINGAINQAILCLQCTTYNSFVFHFLVLKKEWIVSKYIQGGQGNLSGEIIRSISLYIPKKIDEQQRIADCLTSLDEYITAQGRKIELLKEHKKGLMQQLFPRMEESKV